MRTHSREDTAKTQARTADVPPYGGIHLARTVLPSVPAIRPGADFYLAWRAHLTDAPRLSMTSEG